MKRRAWASGFLILLVAAGAVLVAFHWQDTDTVAYYKYSVKPAASSEPVMWPRGNLNVNTADYAELQTLQGINRSQIEALLQDRAVNGEFYYPEDLQYVKGIGEKTLEKIFDQLDFSWREHGN